MAFVHGLQTLSNLTIPGWAGQVFPKQMKVLADFSFALIAYTDEMRRLRGGKIVGKTDRCGRFVFFYDFSRELCIPKVRC